MATAPSPLPLSPSKVIENDHQQPPISLSLPPQTAIPPPPSPIGDVEHHHQPPNSNSPSLSPAPLPPENLADHRKTPPVPAPPPLENVEDHRQLPISPPSPPREEVDDRQRSLAPSPPQSSLPQPPSPSPPTTGAEDPSENLPPSPSPPATEAGDQTEYLISENGSEFRQSRRSPIEREDQFGNPNCSPNHESPLRKHPSPITPPTGPKDQVQIPNYRNNPNPNPNHESPSSPPPGFSSPSSSATALQQHLLQNPSPKADQSPHYPSQSPPPTAPSPSSPQETLEPNTYQTQPPPPPVGVPLLLKTTASFSPNKPQPSPWTHQETVNLIQAYQEKWYSLKKGQLKAGQWEEIAITVAARCGYDEPTKSAKQCRHKIEKLRKRYRAERTKPRSKANAWYFFELMDNMERGPLPISSSQSMALIEYPQPSNSSGKRRKNDDSDSDSDSEFLVNKRSSRSKRSNRIARGSVTRNPQLSVGGSDRVMRGLRTPVVQKQKGFYQEDDGEEEEEDNYDEENDEEEEEGGSEGVAAQLAAEIKGFAERFVKMETKKIEMIRDAERYRMEMENKRMEMILESQQNLVEIVNKAFSSFHKTQKLSAN